MKVKLSLMLLATLGCHALAAEKNAGFIELFSKEGVPSEWMVRRWDDIGKPTERTAVWKTENGIL
ncbi:MAG TPA: hypothetical protein VFA77_14085, partial [Candidatus Eisenbacteria bacterium]|nr:hypothetical protein [Candidatus Eisenbacteria bacterium]